MEFEFGHIPVYPWEYPDVASWIIEVYDREPEDENNFNAFAVYSELKQAVTCKCYVKYTVRDFTGKETYAKRIVWIDGPNQFPSLMKRREAAVELLCDYCEKLENFNCIKPLKEYPKKKGKK